MPTRALLIYSTNSSNVPSNLHSSHICFFVGYCTNIHTKSISRTVRLTDRKDSSVHLLWVFVCLTTDRAVYLFVMFCVLLTVHPCTILQINPTRCTILFSIFISLLYMFRATMCPSSGEFTVSMQHWYLSLCMGGVWSPGWSETPVLYSESKSQSTT